MYKGNFYINDTGPYNASTRYFRNDYMTLNARAYVAAAEIAPGNPPDDVDNPTNNWIVYIAAVGTPGKGDTGYQGDGHRSVYTRVASETDVPPAPTGSWDGTTFTVNSPWTDTLQPGTGIVWRADVRLDSVNDNAIFQPAERWTGPEGPLPANSDVETLLERIITNRNLQDANQVTAGISNYLNANDYLTGTEIQGLINQAYRNVLADLGLIEIEYNLNADADENDPDWSSTLTIYNAVRIRLNNPSARWKPIRLPGTGGGGGTTTGLDVAIQYSVDGTTGWHTTYVAVDNYFRITVGTGIPSQAIPLGSAGTITGLDAELQFSSDNSSWHTAQRATDTYVRFRVGTGAWTDGIKFETGGGGMATTISLQYSNNNADWHDNRASDDNYIRYSADSGTNWTAGVELDRNDITTEYSVNGSTSWHTTRVSGDAFYRFRSGLGSWSDVIPLTIGGGTTTGLNVTVEFSVDGSTSWHTTQVAADRYFRVTIGTGVPSAAIEIGANAVPSSSDITTWSATTTYSNGKAVWYSDGVNWSGILVSRQDNNLDNTPPTNQRNAWWEPLSGNDVTQIEEFYAAEDRIPDATNAFRFVAGTTQGTDGIIEPNPTARWYASIGQIPANRRHLQIWRVLLHVKNWQRVFPETPTPVIDPFQQLQIRADLEGRFPVEPLDISNFQNQAWYIPYRSYSGEAGVDLVDLSFFNASGTALEENVTFESNSLGRLDGDEIANKCNELRKSNSTTGRISVRVVKIYAQKQGSLTHSPTEMTVSGTGYAEIAYSQSYTNFDWTALSPVAQPMVRYVGSVTFTEQTTTNTTTHAMGGWLRMEPVTGTTPFVNVGDPTNQPALRAIDAQGFQFRSSAYNYPATGFDHNLDIDDLFFIGYSQDDIGSNRAKYQVMGNNTIYQTSEQDTHASAPFVVQGAYVDVLMLFWTDNLSTQAKDNFSTEIIKEPFGDGLYGAATKKSDVPKTAQGRDGYPAVYTTVSGSFYESHEVTQRGRFHWVNDAIEGNVTARFESDDYPYWSNLEAGDVIAGRIDSDNYCIARITDRTTRNRFNGYVQYEFEVIDLVGRVNGRSGTTPLTTLYVDSAKPEQGEKGDTGDRGYDAVSASIARSETNSTTPGPLEAHVVFNPATVILNTNASDLPSSDYLSKVPDGTRFRIERLGTTTIWIGNVLSKSVSGDHITYNLEWVTTNNDINAGHNIQIGIGYVESGDDGNHGGDGEIGYSATTFTGPNLRYHATNTTVSAGEIHVHHNPGATTGIIYVHNQGFTQEQAYALLHLPALTPVEVYTDDHSKRLSAFITTSVLNQSTFELTYRVNPGGTKGTFADNDTIHFTIGGSPLTNIRLQYSANGETNWHNARNHAESFARLEVNGVGLDPFLWEKALSLLSQEVLAAPVTDATITVHHELNTPQTAWQNRTMWDFGDNPRFIVNRNLFTFDGDEGQITTGGITSGRNTIYIANPDRNAPTFTMERMDVWLRHYRGTSTTPIASTMIATQTTDQLVRPESQWAISLNETTGATFSLEGGDRIALDITVDLNQADTDNHIVIYADDFQFSFNGDYTDRRTEIRLRDDDLLFYDENLPEDERERRIMSFFTNEVFLESIGIISSTHGIEETHANFDISHQSEYRRSMEFENLPDGIIQEENLITNNTGGVATFVFYGITAATSSLRGENRGSAAYSLTDYHLNAEVLPADSDTAIADRTVNIARLSAGSQNFGVNAPADFALRTVSGEKRVVLQDGERMRIVGEPTPANENFFVMGQSLIIPYSYEVTELSGSKLEMVGDLVEIESDRLPADEQRYAAIDTERKRSLLYNEDPYVRYYVDGQQDQTYPDLLHIDVSDGITNPDRHAGFEIDTSTGKYVPIIPFNADPNELVHEPDESLVTQVNESDVSENVDEWDATASDNFFDGLGDKTGVFSFEPGIYNIEGHFEVLIPSPTTVANSTIQEVLFKEGSYNDVPLGDHIYIDVDRRTSNGNYYLAATQSGANHVYVYGEFRTQGSNFNYISNHPISTSDFTMRGITVTEDRIWIIGDQASTPAAVIAVSMDFEGNIQASEQRTITTRVARPRGATYYNGQIIILDAADDGSGKLVFYSHDMRTFIREVTLPAVDGDANEEWKGVTVLDGNFVSIEHRGLAATHITRFFEYPEHSATALTEIEHLQFTTRAINYESLTSRPSDGSLLFPHNGGTKALQSYYHGLRDFRDRVLARSTQRYADSDNDYKSFDVKLENFRPKPGRQYYYQVRGVSTGTIRVIGHAKFQRVGEIE